MSEIGEGFDGPNTTNPLEYTTLLVQQSHPFGAVTWSTACLWTLLFLFIDERHMKVIDFLDFYLQSPGDLPLGLKMGYPLVVHTRSTGGICRAQNKSLVLVRFTDSLPVP